MLQVESAGWLRRQTRQTDCPAVPAQELGAALGETVCFLRAWGGGVSGGGCRLFSVVAVVSIN